VPSGPNSTPSTTRIKKNCHNKNGTKQRQNNYRKGSSITLRIDKIVVTQKIIDTSTISENIEIIGLIYRENLLSNLYQKKIWNLSRYNNIRYNKL
jgi:hypothetical protein